MSSFPSSVKSFTTKLSGDTVQASHVNDVQSEVTAIETALVGGTLPAANGSALTALNASNLSSGTVAEARLGTGTGTVNKVLRGNGTWGDAPGLTTDGASAVQQVAFAAAQSASTGANVLDDYEEGTFTPAINFGGARIGVTGTEAGTYVKIGQMVYVNIRLTLTSKGSSAGAATITGLPFTSHGSVNGGLAVNYVSSLGASVASVLPYIAAGVSTVTLTYIPAAGAASVSNMTDATFANVTDIILSGCYRAAA